MQYGYPPVMGPRAPRALRHRGVDQAKRNDARVHDVVYSWVDLVGTSSPSLWGAIAGGLVARIYAAERQRSAEPPETASTLAGMTHSHTMQEPLPARPASVSALTPASGRKEMTTNRAAHGIVVGFAP
jgi:hypothetical protein